MFVRFCPCFCQTPSSQSRFGWLVGLDQPAVPDVTSFFFFRGLPLKQFGALLVSPVDAHLLEAPQLNWQDGSFHKPPFFFVGQAGWRGGQQI